MRTLYMGFFKYRFEAFVVLLMAGDQGRGNIRVIVLGHRIQVCVTRSGQRGYVQ